MVAASAPYSTVSRVSSMNASSSDPRCLHVRDAQLVGAVLGHLAALQRDGLGQPLGVRAAHQHRLLLAFLGRLSDGFVIDSGRVAQKNLVSRCDGSAELWWEGLKAESVRRLAVSLDCGSFRDGGLL